MSLNDQYIPIKRQLMTGVNTKQHPLLIGETQVEIGHNMDFSQLGRNAKREGFATESNDVGSNAFTNLVYYNPNGGAPIMLGMEDTNLRKYTGSGNWSAALDAGFTTDLYTMFVVGNDEVLISNGTDNAHTIDSADSVTDLGDTNTSPPKGVVGAYAFDRFFVAEGDKVYFSDVASTTFDRSANFFRVNIGDNSAGEITNIVLFRDKELVIFKPDSTWVLYADGTTPLTDWALKIHDSEYGCVSKEAAKKVGNDIHYWGIDGPRSIKRNAQDKLYGLELPTSDAITDWVEGINHGALDQIRAIYFKNRLIFAVPYGASTIANYWYVYFFQENPQFNGWSIWSEIDTAAFCKFPISGEEKLFFSDGNDDGQIYNWPSGTSDNGTAIECELRGRQEDFSKEGIGPVAKVLQNMYLVFETNDDSEVTIDVQTDEGGFITLGTEDLTSDAPVLPQMLPFDLNAKTIIRVKLAGDLLEHWYNMQWRVTQDTLDHGFTLQEVIMMVTFEKYEWEV